MSFTVATIAARAGLVLVLGLLAGCGGEGDGFERADVTGTVTLDGKPLPYGTLYLKGKVNERSEAAQTFLPVRDGKFDSQSGARPGVGENTARVAVYLDDPDQPDARMKGVWSGTTIVQEGQPIQMEIKSSELKPE